MNRPSGERNQACLNYRATREMTFRSIDRVALPHFVQRARSRREIPPAAEGGGFEPPVREPVRQFSKLLVSATHPSFQKDLGVRNRGVISLIAGAKVRLFFEPCKFFGYFFHIPLHFSIKSEFRSLEHDAFQLRNSPIKTLSSRHHLKIVQYVTWETWYIWSY